MTVLELPGASKAAPLNYEGCSEDGEKSNVCDLNYLVLAQLELEPASELTICWGTQPSQAAPLWPPCQLCWRPLCRGVSWSLRESVAWVIQRYIGSRWSVLLMAFALPSRKQFRVETCRLCFFMLWGMMRMAQPSFIRRAYGWQARQLCDNLWYATYINRFLGNWVAQYLQ